MIYPKCIYLKNKATNIFYVIKLVGNIRIEKDTNHKIMYGVEIIKTNDDYVISHGPNVNINLNLTMFDKRTKEHKYYDYKVLTESEILAYAM